jgi:hypothetical protein
LSNYYPGPDHARDPIRPRDPGPDHARAPIMPGTRLGPVTRAPIMPGILPPRPGMPGPGPWHHYQSPGHSRVPGRPASFLFARGPGPPEAQPGRLGGQNIGLLYRRRPLATEKNIYFLFFLGGPKPPQNPLPGAQNRPPGPRNGVPKPIRSIPGWAKIFKIFKKNKK